MSNITESDRKLNEMILNGKGMDGFEEFYAHDCTMQENKEAPIVGKDANRKREHEFMKTVEAVHGGRVVASAVSGDTSFSEWEFEMTIKGMGRVKMEQVAVRKWRDGKVVAERFYHNP